MTVAGMALCGEDHRRPSPHCSRLALTDRGAADQRLAHRTSLCRAMPAFPRVLSYVLLLVLYLVRCVPVRV